MLPDVSGHSTCGSDLTELLRDRVQNDGSSHGWCDVGPPTNEAGCPSPRGRSVSVMSRKW